MLKRSVARRVPSFANDGASQTGLTPTKSGGCFLFMVLFRSSEVELFLKNFSVILLVKIRFKHMPYKFSKIAQNYKRKKISNRYCKSVGLNMVLNNMLIENQPVNRLKLKKKLADI